MSSLTSLPITLTVLVSFFLSPLTIAAMTHSPAKALALSPADKAAHLFDRLSFGARPGDVERMRSMGDRGIRVWIENQLHPESIDDANVDHKLAELKSLKMSSPQLIEYYQKPEEVAVAMGIKAEDFKKSEDLKKEIREKIGEDKLPEAIIRELTAQRLIRAVESRRQLQEVLVDFWLNHFNIDISKGEEKWLVPEFEQKAIRGHLFGKFSDLLRATAHSPAMLFYLDNQNSESEINYVALEHWQEKGRKGPEPKHRNNGINENYARELLELHTLGVDAGYTQGDVTTLARILTGWSIDSLKTNPEFKFKDQTHDRGEKTFLGQSFPAGHGIDEGERALDLILKHPATARFICTKLARYFVSDTPPQDLVDRMVQVWSKTDGDLRAVYHELFLSADFWSPAVFRAKVKRPLQFTVSAIRALGGELDTKNDLHKLLAGLGEEPYRCAPPTGYKDTAEAWVNPGAMVGRLNFAIKVTSNRIEGIYSILPTISKLPAGAGPLLEAVESRLLHERLSPASQKVVLRQFEGQTWSMAEGEVRPINLTKAVALILGSPEFQRR